MSNTFYPSTAPRTSGTGPAPLTAAPAHPQKEHDIDASVPAVLFAEFLAACFFVFIGGSVVSITGHLDAESRSFLRIFTVALIDGLCFYVLVYMVMKLTRGRSGYFNSSLTLALCLVDLYLEQGHKMGPHIGRAIAHAAVQIVGSLLGAVFILLLVPGALDGAEKTGVSQPMTDFISPAGAFFLQVIFNVFFVFVVLSVRNNENKKSSLILAFCMMCCRLVLFPSSSSTLNPARALAHAVVGDGMRYFWLFFLAPLTGATIGTLLFVFMHRNDQAA